MQVQWWGYHQVVKTLKLYYLLKNLFELIALKGSGMQTIWVEALMPIVSAHSQTFTT